MWRDYRAMERNAVDCNASSWEVPRFADASDIVQKAGIQDRAAESI